MGKTDWIGTLLGPPLLVASIAFFVSLAPREVIDFLTAWTLLSCPVGVLVGHLALSEEPQGPEQGFA